MARRPKSIELTREEDLELQLVSTRETGRAAIRARIVLGCAAGQSNDEIAEVMDVSRACVSQIRNRFAKNRLEALRDRPRSGRPPTCDMDALALSQEDRTELERLSRRPKTSAALARRASIVLNCADGNATTSIAARLGCSAAAVRKWRRRFTEKGLDGLLDEPRPGAKRTIKDEDVERVVMKTLEGVPKDATQWSVRSMAKAANLSNDAVHRIWRAFELKPHLTETFKVSTDPFFVEKVRDIVGLYLNPPERAVVFSVDEKSQIQALDRTQPLLPMQMGRPELRTHDYKRNGTTSLFAALNVATGNVIGKCYRSHRSVEFKKFLERIDAETEPDLDIHLVIDNYSTHKTAMIHRWLLRHQRFHLHFTPTSASWINQVERWFGELTRKRIRRGTFNSTQALEQAIYDYLECYNDDPRPFKWTKSADEILGKVKRFCESINL